MVLAYPGRAIEKHVTRRGDFSTVDKKYVERFMSADNATESNRPSAIRKTQKMTFGVAPRDPISLIDFTIRQDDKAKTISCDSMTPDEQRGLLMKILDYMSPGGRKIGYNDCRLCHGRKRRQSGLENDVSAETESGDESRRFSISTASSSTSHTFSQKKSRADHSSRSNKRKRARKQSSESPMIAIGPQGESLESCQVEQAKWLSICDEQEVKEFYIQILEDGQQTLCKKLAKCWIRTIYPNKQSSNPYSKGAGSKPFWWPSTPPENAAGVPTKGTKENGLVRHREPDHIGKAERLTLLPHMLNQITDPSNTIKFNSINITKLHHISIESINNEHKDKKNHESWRRFTNEIFRVARMQERYKNGEIDDTTLLNILHSYDSWRYKGSLDEEEEEDSESDRECDDDQDDDIKPIITQSPSEQNPSTQNRSQPQLLKDDANQGCPGYLTHDRFARTVKIDNGQGPYLQTNDIQNPMSNHAPCSASMPMDYLQPSPVLQDPIRRHSDSSNRFSGTGSYYQNFQPNINMAHNTNLQYQEFQHSFPLSTTSNSTIGSNLPIPVCAPVPGSLYGMSQLPIVDDPRVFPHSNEAFQASGRDPVLTVDENLHQLPQQPQGFLDYLNSQDYSHNAPKITHAFNLNNATRLEFAYDQDDANNAPISEFIYEAKPQCSHVLGTFDVDDTANGGSHGHSEHGR